MIFIHLGFGEPFPISGSHGLGLGDLLDEVAKNFPEEEEEEYDDEVIQVFFNWTSKCREIITCQCISW